MDNSNDFVKNHDTNGITTEDLNNLNQRNLEILKDKIGEKLTKYILYKTIHGDKKWLNL